VTFYTSGAANIAATTYLIDHFLLDSTGHFNPSAPLGDTLPAGGYYVDTISNGSATLTAASTVVISGATSGQSQILTGSGLGDVVLVFPQDTVPPGAFVPQTQTADIYDENAGFTYQDVGGNNMINFAHGNDSYVGTNSNGGHTTVWGGVGQDSIRTGAAEFVTAYGGTGGTYFDLHDTTAAGAKPNDLVWASEAYGAATVNAAGQNDVVGLMNGGSDLSDGSNSASGTVAVLIGGSGNNISFAADKVDAGQVAAGKTVNERHDIVFDNGSGNLIQGGAGVLWYMMQDAGTSTIMGGSGEADIFGTAGSTINYIDTQVDRTGMVRFVAGGNNTEIDAAGAKSTIVMFGYTDTTSAANNETLIGGSGSENLFFTGGGNETLIGGSGRNFYNIANTSLHGDHGGIITIDTLNGGAASIGGDAVNFVNYGFTTLAQLDNIATAGHTVSVDGQTAFQITLADNTSVRFVGISSAAQLETHLTTNFF
jgi:hypothetical protein